MANNGIKKLGLPSSTTLTQKESSKLATKGEAVPKTDTEQPLPPIPEDIASRLLPSAANADPEFALFLVLQAEATALPFTDSPREWSRKFITGAVRSIAPRDALEALLAVQMVRTHNLALQYLELAGSKNQTVTGIEMFSNFANRLLRTFTAQMETLKSYRTKGEQRVEVKHVHVNRGGQAVVGTVNHTTGGGDADKK